MKLSKKVITVVIAFLAVVALAACGSKNYKVSFESNGGSEVATIKVDKNAMATEPEDPTKSGQNFTGWFKDKNLTVVFDFTTRITSDIKLYAGWTENVVVRLNTKSPSSTLAPVELGKSGGTLQQPATPIREGFVFKGWYYGRAGLTWLEEEAVKFPLQVSESTRLHAYWEPINSATVTYSPEETYTSSLTSDTSLILNPLNYKWSHETELIAMLVTPLYSTEVDWDLAIAQGVASAPGDFSKIENKEFSIDALDYRHVLVGAESYPKNSDGEDFLIDGVYDRTVAAQKTDTQWTFTLRRDLKFQDGTPIDARTFEYTLQQFLNKDQNNYRSTIFYKNTENKNGYPILNAEDYLKGNKGWEEVGFKVDSSDPYTFTVTTFEPITQANAVALANAIRLVHPEKYAQSLDSNGVNSKYGTPAHPYVSYGSYVIKSWDENQKLVFNKNYDYVDKGTINYKSIVYQIVDNVDQRMQLFENGQLSVAGLSQNYYTKYAEDSRVKRSWNGYPQYLVINTADGNSKKGSTYKSAEILFDVRFRQALLYGFDRLYYANSVYQPNTASLLPIPLDTKSYMNDVLYYSQSPDHLAVLEKYGIDPASEGFLAERAKSLFNEAYTDWKAAGNSGAIKINFLIENDDFSLGLARYIKESYEKLFGADKIEIVLDTKDATGVSDATAKWEFDISLNAIGFGASYGAFWQYPGIAFFGALLGAADLGLSQPYDSSTESGTGAYLDTMVEVDLSNTLRYIESLSAELYEDLEAEHLHEFLKGTADKPAGIFRGTLEDLGMYILNDDKIYDQGPSSAPFAGATEDTWKIIAVFEEAFLEYATLIPTVTRSSATIYASNVVIEWPEYSVAFAWGSNRYRYLNTDPDFFTK